MVVYAFLDLEHAPTAWAVMRGMLVSAKLNPDYSTGCISFLLAGIIRNGNNSRLFNEQVFEGRRRIKHPMCVSRIGGMFFFEDRDLALRATKKWRGHFKEPNLFALELTPQGVVSRLDSDWITLAETDATGRVDPRNHRWMDRYWRGEPRSDKPGWELLCDGFAVVLDERARRTAHELVKQKFPDCQLAVELARLASECDASPAGMITPWLIQAGNNSIDLTYLLRDKEFNQRNTIEAMSRHPNFGNLINHWHEADSIQIPDFGPWTTNFEPGLQLTNDMWCAASVHKS